MMTAIHSKDAPFYTLLDQASQAVFVVQDGKLVYLNPFTSRLSGYSAEELMARPFPAFIHPDDQAMVMDRHVRRLAGEDLPQGYPFRIIGKNGRVLWVELNATLTDWRGKPATLNFLRDISEQRESEDALRASREELRLTLDATTDGIWQWNFRTSEMRFSSRYYTMLGYEPGAFPASFRAWQALVHPDDLPSALSFARTYLGNQPDDYENMYRIRTASGEYRWIHSRARVVERDDEGNAVRMIGRIEDITKLKAAEAELHDREGRYRALFDSIRDPILVAERERNVIDCNPAFTELFEYTLAEIQGRTTSVIYDNEERFEEMGHALEASLGLREIVSAIDFRKKSGEIFPGEVKISYLRDKEGKIAGVVGQIRDLSERLRAEAERAELESQFRQAQKLEAVGRLTGGVAHDFNNLLTVIVGYNDLMLMDLEEGNPLRKHALQLRNAVNKATALISQLMAFSRKQVLQPEVLNLNGALSNLRKMLPRIIGEDIELTVTLEKDPGKVKADLGLIEQMIMNLVVNARDAMPRGGKLTLGTQNADLDEVYARHHAGVAPGAYVMLFVSDTGVGIPRENLDKVFDPFFTTKEKGEGTGLGLSTVYGIVKQHGGHIRVYSEPGHGTCFKVYLPRVTDGMQRQRPSQEASLTGGSETILLVEDDKDVIELIQAMLQSLGYTVITAFTGEEALAAASHVTGPLDLLMTDLVMPGMNGRELAERMGAIRPDIKVVFMSGYTDETMVRHGVLEREKAFIQKPFSLPALAQKVRQVLGGPVDATCGR